jgi:hypothetical protein
MAKGKATNETVEDSAIGRERSFNLQQMEYYDRIRAPHHQCEICGVWHQNMEECPCCQHIVKEEERERYQEEHERQSQQRWGEPPYDPCGPAKPGVCPKAKEPDGA